MKDKKKNLRLWGISLMALGISGLTMVCSQFGWYDLPDWLIRTLGILCLIALPVVAFSTVKMMKQNAE